MVGAGLLEDLPAPQTAYLLARFCLDVFSYAATFFDDISVPVSQCSLLARHSHFYSLHTEFCIQLKAGMHSGPLVAGVVGATRRFYRVFGDTG